MQVGILDVEELPWIVDYLPLLVAPADLESVENRKFVHEARWHLPKPAEIRLIAIDGSGKELSTMEVAASDPTATVEMREFLERHQTPDSNAMLSWKQALPEAARTDRRVLVQFGGPRCAPCFCSDVGPTNITTSSRRIKYREAALHYWEQDQGPCG
jgi:hypothetical protein